MTETDGFGIDGFDRTVERLKRDLAARDAELAAMKAENSKLRSALEIVHFKQEPWQ